MNTSDAKSTGVSLEEDFPLHFSEWLKRRRQGLDLTQEQLAQRASCSVFAIRKMESGERQPSRQLARMLAQALELPCEEQAVFIKAARGEVSMERLISPARTPSRDPQPADKSDPLPVNLPRALTPFIGREPELSALGQMLHDPQCSLLTIVGPGGLEKHGWQLKLPHAKETYSPMVFGLCPLPRSVHLNISSRRLPMH